MAALTADRRIVREDPSQSYAPVEEAVTIFGGSIVCRNSAGYAVPGADTSGFIFAGIARAQVDNSLGADGDLDVELITEGVVQLAATGLGINDVGAKLYVADDQTVKLGQDVTNGIYIGTLDRYISSTVAAVRLDVANRREKRGTIQSFVFAVAGNNASALDLTGVAADRGGADIYVTEVETMWSIAAGTPDAVNILAITTDYTVASGNITIVGDKSAVTLFAIVRGRLED